MLQYLYNFVTSKYFIVYWIICIIYVELALRKLKKLQPKNEEEIERDKKYFAFKMIEAVKADQIHFRILLYIFAPLSIFKILFAFSSIFLNAIFVYTLVSILGRRNPIFRQAAYITTTFTGRILCWCSSIIWITTERPEVCYKKYLGPDWKPSYDNPGSIVGNHSSWADTPVTMSRQPPANVAKASVGRLPGIGTIAKAVGSIFVERVNKDQKKDTITLISERQKECEQGLEWPLIIYPEGGTTNGTTLIKFQKGAFVGLNSVMPIGIKYDSGVIPLSTGSMPFESHMALAASNPYAFCTVKEFPVFKPNEYFFQNHQKEGEEKWETYARVIRQLLSEQLNLKLSDVSIYEKFEYRKMVLKNSKYGE